jgi:hypothetical protein
MVHKVLLQPLPVLKAPLELKDHKDQLVRKVLQVHKVQHLQLLVLKVLKDYKALKVQLVLKDLLE